MPSKHKNLVYISKTQKDADCLKDLFLCILSTFIYVKSYSFKHNDFMWLEKLLNFKHKEFMWVIKHIQQTAASSSHFLND